MIIKTKVPEKLEPLYNEYLRYVILEGGRGGMKSHGIAESQLIRGMKRPMLFLDAREIQKSIADSVHHLLEKKISDLHLGSYYKVLETEIRGINGTSFIFAGLKHNIANIKSIEDVDECWVEEAQSVSDSTWTTLIPTIRKEISPCCYTSLGIGDEKGKPCTKCGKMIPLDKIIPSRIVISYNPELEDDPTHQRFFIHSPTNSKRIHLTYKDNPWFTGVLRQEMEDLKETNYQEYLHVYEGQCRQAVQGAIFAKELQKVSDEGRITNVEYDPSVPVCTYWDLGKGAMTAIWFIQYVGMQWRILRHYSNSQEDLNHYLKYVQSMPYVYEKHFLPHDGEQKRIGMILTVKEQAEKVLKNVQTVPRIHHKLDAINAVKQVLPICYFDKELCADGLSDLRHYAYRVTEDGKVSNEPEEGTTFRDTADAFMTFAQSCRFPKPPEDELDILLRKQKQKRGGAKTAGKWWA